MPNLTPSYLYFLLHHLTIFLCASSSPHSSYIPELNYVALACGLASNATAIDGRNWTADTNSKFYSSHQNNASATFAEPPDKLATVPYTTARISRSQLTYIFPVTAGTQFIRLHFYPASYRGFNNSIPSFSIKADTHILVHNLNAVDYAKALGFEIFYKELWVGVKDDQMLHLTFTPTSGMDHVYAFINGIETMSVPTDIYYTAASNPRLKFLGMDNPLGLENKTSVELMYRINVGGEHIPPTEDKVLYRCWSSDEHFLTVSKPSIVSSNTTINLTFSDFTRFAAPDVLYRTGRSMGIGGKTVSENYNLTWEFQVISGFTYFVRLYFCEFQPDITQAGDRVFQIYIDNEIAESKADIIYWSGGNGIPVYKDYAVTLKGNGNGGKKLENLSIALLPVLENRTRYSNAILNGIEIFRLMELEIDPMPTQKSKKLKNVDITIVSIVGGGAVLGFVLCFLIVGRKVMKGKNSSQFLSPEENTKIHTTSLSCRKFSLNEIKSATKKFDNVSIIGVGGFGNVYKGTINDIATSVAIKRLSQGSEQGASEFRTEIEMLSQLRHRHLVSLIGYCNKDEEMILVYEYMDNGTLCDHLYNTSNPSLPWKQRLEICIGAARGLRYLHSEAKNTIIHRDVKSSNILLNKNWVAKVSDFGLSKMRPNNNSNNHIITAVKGSYGYLDPEYYRRHQLTEKSDVYSFGVVLFEVLCARPAVDQTILDDYDDQVSLAVWAKQCYCNGTINQIIDPFLKGKIAPECFKIFSEIAVSCLLDERVKRPSMCEVVSGLELALQIQETAKNRFEHVGLHFDLDLPFQVSPDIISSIKTSSIDESYSQLWSQDSYTHSSVDAKPNKHIF